MGHLRKTTIRFLSAYSKFLGSLTFTLWFSMSLFAQTRVLDGIDSAGLAFSSDGKFLAAAGSKPPKSRTAGYINKMKIGTSGFVKVWELATGRQVFEYENNYWQATSLSFCPGTSLLAVGFERKWRLVTDINDRVPPAPVMIWNVRTGKKVGRFLHDRNEGQLNGISKICFSPDGKILAAATWKRLTIWNVKSGETVFTTREMRHAAIDDLVFSRDGKTLACVSTDVSSDPSPKMTVIELWEIAKQVKKRHGGLEIPNDRTALAFAPDTMQLAAACWVDATIRIFDVQREKLTRSFKAHKNMLQSAAYGPKGKLLYTGGGSDGCWKSWNSVTLKLLATESSPYIKCLAVSPDGRFLATGSTWTDCAVRVWKLQAN